MPNPTRYPNTDEGYKNYMDQCMHQTLHMERKEKDQAVAQCLNSWRQVHGPKRPGKKKKANLIPISDAIKKIIPHPSPSK